MSAATSETELKSILNALRDSAKRSLDSSKSNGAASERHEVLNKSINDLCDRLEQKLKNSVAVLAEPPSKRQKTDDADNDEDEQPDDELIALEKAVHEIAGRVATYREEVPALLVRQLNDHMESFRPSLDQAASLALEAPESTSSDDQAPGITPPGDLWHKFQQAASQIPGLRVRLEKTLDRLERVISAVEAEKSRSARTPTTIDRVLRERPRDDDEDEEGEGQD